MYTDLYIHHMWYAGAVLNHAPTRDSQLVCLKDDLVVGDFDWTRTALKPGKHSLRSYAKYGGLHSYL